ISRAVTICCFWNPGVRKTRLAVALGRNACEQGMINESWMGLRPAPHDMKMGRMRRAGEQVAAFIGSGMSAKEFSCESMQGTPHWCFEARTADSVANVGSKHARNGGQPWR